MPRSERDILQTTRPVSFAAREGNGGLRNRPADDRSRLLSSSGARRGSMPLSRLGWNERITNPLLSTHTTSMRTLARSQIAGFGWSPALHWINLTSQGLQSPCPDGTFLTRRQDIEFVIRLPRTSVHRACRKRTELCRGRLELRFAEPLLRTAQQVAV